MVQNVASDYRYVASRNVTFLAFAGVSHYLRVNCSIRRDAGTTRKVMTMDDSHNAESSAASTWGAGHYEDDDSMTGKVAFTIGELSREFGVTLRALRFYENKGLISPHRDGLSRLYSQGDRTRLALILKGKKLGFTLGEIRQMIAAEEGDAAPDRNALSLSQEKCLEQIEMLQRQKAEIEEGLSELHRIYAQLSGKLGEGDHQRG
jgi:DNA-binding transcriptional MerR regulator